MTSAWTVAYAPRGFIKPIEDFRNHTYTEVAEALRRSDRSKLEELVRLNDEADAFSSAVEEIRAGSLEAIQSLRPARDLGQGPSINYRVLRVGTWRGYYLVDHTKRLCQGLLVIRKSTKTTADLIAALREAAKELAAKPADPQARHDRATNFFPADRRRVRVVHWRDSCRGLPDEERRRWR